MRTTWRHAGWPGLRLTLAALIVALAACGGCVGLGLSNEELELLDASTADARFMDRTWSDRSEAERREFAGQNAQRWQYFDDLAHGRSPGTAEGSDQ
jgi:hypothetical protein